MNKPTRATLVALKLGLEHSFANDEVFSWNINVMTDWLTDSVRCEFSTRIWSEQLQDETIEYPYDWWQSLKDRWSPKWMRRRWPVRYVTHVFRVNAVYPNLTPQHGMSEETSKRFDYRFIVDHHEWTTILDADE